MVLQKQGRRQGVCLGGGGAKLQKCIATAARAIKFCASPEKVARGGGGGGGIRHIFFFSTKDFPHTFRNGVRVLSWP